MAPEDMEFMKALKKSVLAGFIEPVLIGHKEKIEETAEAVNFDMGRCTMIFEEDRQAISDLAVAMLFRGEVDMASKGQIPTAYVYRSMIRQESQAKSGRTISVISFWEIPGLDRLIALTDTGVNIRPDLRAKAAIVKNAVSCFHLFGYPRPRVGALSGMRHFDGVLASFDDMKELRGMAAAGELGDCEILEETSFAELFLEPGTRLRTMDDISIDKIPDIILIPHLDTGNILVKLDFFLPVVRRSFVATSRGPVIIPSRSDTAERIVGELALGAVAADRMKGRIL